MDSFSRLFAFCFILQQVVHSKAEISVVRMLFKIIKIWSYDIKPKAYFPLGDFVRVTRRENKNSMTWLVKIG